MAYIGIGSSNADELFLEKFVEKYSTWLDGDRQPRFHGKGFIVLYDSNTARELVKKCLAEAEAGTISIYSMNRLWDQAGVN